jgi:hypothetical protein
VGLRIQAWRLGLFRGVLMNIFYLLRRFGVTLAANAGGALGRWCRVATHTCCGAVGGGTEDAGGTETRWLGFAPGAAFEMKKNQGRFYWFKCLLVVALSTSLPVGRDL